jgi:NAD(P)-dependent dehydrogenase (short-subunit alcohol dehydrogenase family)
MATQPKFPGQNQSEQPGAEHQMDPQPSSLRSKYKPSDKLKGKVALITGGDSGIGRAVAHHFAMEGASVAFTYLSDIEKKDADEVVQIVKESSVEGAKEPLAIQVDLGYDEHCKKVIDDVVKHFGTIDILVNNCAEQHYHGSLEEISSEEWERTFRTNIHSYFYLTKYALPHMKEGSAIVNSTSVNAYKGNSGLIPYSTTKGAIVAFTRSLALSVVGKGIRVNGVAPGPVWTPLIPSSATPEKVEKFGSTCPMDRAGQPDEIAPSYVFLASADASFFSGQVLHPNGGVVVNA